MNGWDFEEHTHQKQIFYKVILPTTEPVLLELGPGTPTNGEYNGNAVCRKLR